MGKCRLSEDKRNEILEIIDEYKDRFYSLVELAYRSYEKTEKKLALQGIVFLCIYFLEKIASIDTFNY
jgi:hypothetical protein